MIAPPTVLSPDYLHFREAAVRLGQQSYVLAPPPWVDAANLAIDRECCHETVCGTCGNEGLRAEPFHRQEPRSYVVLGVCPACLGAEEM